MTVLRLITGKAKALGACDKADNVKNYKELVDRLFLKQGLSWCVKNRFPRLLHFNMLKPYLIDERRVYVDKGEIDLSNIKEVCIVGNTHANITYDGGKCIHRVICFYGASASIKAQNKAVVRVYKVDAGNITIDKDSSSIILNDVTPENAQI